MSNNKWFLKFQISGVVTWHRPTHQWLRFDKYWTIVRRVKKITKVTQGLNYHPRVVVCLDGRRNIVQIYEHVSIFCLNGTSRYQRTSRTKKKATRLVNVKCFHPKFSLSIEWTISWDILFALMILMVQYGISAFPQSSSSKSLWPSFPAHFNSSFRQQPMQPVLAGRFGKHRLWGKSQLFENPPSA